ncbi:hypothetical protein ACIRBX_26505 [Kitasatospora sp. NPDC096147]|uniref:hypothetical protein n=1 Tax=Kitasatospora sp. NPDC096147 TaxID=3364093 RepID=UPI00380A607D
MNDRWGPTPPYLPLGLWWLIAAVCSLTFLALFVPPMPTTAHRIRIALTPPALAAGAVLMGFQQDLDARHLVPMYACMLIGFQLGLVGRGREMRRVAIDTLAYEAGEDGATTRPQLSAGAYVQLACALLPTLAATLWFVAVP